ncbi:hypothetical protein L226DRAFT_61503 [Lentinus tigrinus ALCF2SS1-7]|uniref:Uncharacterized protein n=1 Tax=Lentinus tigrinus ALCF2SS1-6 TaxID=1328759 RepID=A0A5C2RM98_9APHY|nr:hypothetical protein L227DRAFT_71725 [Lentinus tigrinus ALCF2SS1-6]RPD67712.1 hypothetical protein L226DRAFT_61503 [Lentinus tigrinus ALCF2SS1-7]
MSDTNSTLCPSENQSVIDQSTFWDSDGIDWDAHKIGWVVAGCCAVVTLILTAINVSFHARHYTNRGEQRQMYVKLSPNLVSFPPLFPRIFALGFGFFWTWSTTSRPNVREEHLSMTLLPLRPLEQVGRTLYSCGELTEARRCTCKLLCMCCASWQDYMRLQARRCWDRLFVHSVRQDGPCPFPLHICARFWRAEYRPPFLS